MNELLTRRIFLQKSIIKTEFLRKELVPTNDQNSKIILKKNIPININIKNDRFEIITNINYEDNGVQVGNITKWYDPITKEYLTKNENVYYIIDENEI